MASESEKADTVDSDEAEEDQYEVERIIDMRTEAGEVLYRVRWKNYASDDDTWEPEAHLEDCREVLLAYKRHLAEAKANREQDAKKGSKLPMKSDVFQAESSDSDRQRPTEQPVKKKKKKKTRHEDEPSSKEKRKKKKDKRKDDFRPRPAPSSDEEQEEERAPSPAPSWSRKDKTSDSKKRVVDSEDEEDVPPKKHKKEKSKDGGKHSKAKAEEGKKKKKDDTKGRRLEVESSEDESAAPLEEDLSDSQSDVPSKKKTGKSELKLKGIKDFLQDKKSKKAETSSPTPSQKESSLAKLKSLTSSKSQAREEAAEQSSDSGDSSTLHKKSKSKAQESAPAPAKVPSSASSTSSSSSMVTASTSKARDEEPREDVSREKEQSSSTNLFDKFLLNCEAKDHAKAARRQTVHPPAAEPVKAPKLIGKIEKRSKPPADKPEDKAERSRHADDDKAEPEADTMGDKRAEETAQRSKFRDDSRDRRDRLEDVQRAGWERRTPTSEAMDRRRKREDSEPRLFMACDDNLDPQDSLEGSDKSDKGQASLSLGMDLNLDWMVMDEFQKHLNGEDELLSAPPLSPSELRDAVKSGDYMSVKLALNSKEDYNLDQEECTVDEKILFDEEKRLIDEEKSSVNGNNSKDQYKKLSDDEQKNLKSTDNAKSSGDEKSSSDEEKRSKVKLRSCNKKTSRKGSRVNLRSSDKKKCGKEKSSGDEEESSVVKLESSYKETSCDEERRSRLNLRSSNGKKRLKYKEKSSGDETESSSDESSSSSEFEDEDSEVRSVSDYLPSDESLSSSDNETEVRSNETPRKKYADRKAVRSSLRSSSSPRMTIPLSKVVDGKRKWDKRHFCPYCNTPHSKIARHLERRHIGEEAVDHALSFPKGSQMRLTLFDELRNKGDFQHNYEVLKSENGELVTKKRPTNPASVRDFLPCQFCQAFYRKSDLWRHERKCKHKKGEGEKKRKDGRNRVQAMSSRLLPGGKYATGGCEEIIHNMNQDEIAVHIKNDPLICKYGNALSARHDHDKSQFAYIAQKMRELARFMVAVNELDKSVKYLHELCLPSKFELAVEGAKKVSGFDAGSNKFRTTSLVSKIGYSLKRAAEIAFGESRMTEDSEAEGHIREFIKLLDTRWYSLFSRSALRRAESKEVDTSSLTGDLINLHTFLKNAEVEAKKELQENPTPSSWKKLSEALLAEVVLFNKSRGGDTGKLLLETYLDRKKMAAPETADVLNRLTKLEVALGDKLTRMELKGNQGRKMPLLLSQRMLLSLDILIEHREKAGVPKDNPYVFGRLEALSNTRGSDCLRKVSHDSKTKIPDIITSSRFRKRIASLFQLLHLRESELDRVAQLVGVDHGVCYGLSEDPSRLEKLSLQVLALDRKQVERDGAHAMGTPAIPRKRWSDAEQAAVMRQLGRLISMRIVPNKKQCDACINAEPVLQSRTWRDIKNYVHNTRKRPKLVQSSSHTQQVPARQKEEAINLKRKREEEGDVNGLNKTAYVQGGAGEGRPVLGAHIHSGAMEGRPVPGTTPRKRATWSKEEQAAVRRHFKEFAWMMKAPGKRECDACIAAEPALKDRVWKDIKNYVHNTLQTMKRRGCVSTPPSATGGHVQQGGTGVQPRVTGGPVQVAQESMQVDELQNSLTYLCL